MISHVKISVIVPIYIVPPEYLRACLDSLAAQTLQECEFIMVSDGAPDAENQICEEYTQKDFRFKFFKKEHKGVSAARNFGIKQATGEYISFVDSDDWIDSNMLQDSYNFANERSLDVLTMNFFETKNNTDTLRIQDPKTKDPISFLRQILTGKIFGGMPLRIIKKTFYNKRTILFPEHIGYCEDILFWVHFLQTRPKIDYLNKAFYHYVQDNNNSITRNYTIEKYIERKKFIKVLKEILPSTFDSEINMAAFNVKMEAMRYGLLSSNDYMSFEKTYLKSLFFSNQTLRRKAYLLFNTMYMAIFKKPFRDFL